MAYQEVKTTSYGTRVGNSFRGIGSGILLFIAATVLLWWNEGRAVKTTKMLNEAQGAYVEMEDPGKIDPALDGELVHATAVATTQDSLIDTRFGFGATAISLQRSVEYYQWVEHSESETEDKLGGKEVTTTTYTYSKEWVSSPVQSESFKDPEYQNKNRVLAVVDSDVQWARKVTFGAYKLNDAIVHSISSCEPVQLAIDEAILKDLNDGVSRIQKKDSLNYVHQAANVLYIGRVPASPEVGDVRITWEKVVPAKVTIISQVDGDTFKPYTAKNGKTFQTLVMGKKDASEIFESEHSTNKILLWVLRILGVILVIAGLKGIFGFLQTILKVVPFLANILGWGVSLVCFVAGLAWSLVVIALAWLTYRPVLGISLLVIAGLLVWVFAFKGKAQLKKLAAKASGQPDEQP